MISKSGKKRFVAPKSEKPINVNPYPQKKKLIVGINASKQTKTSNTPALTDMTDKPKIKKENKDQRPKSSIKSNFKILHKQVKTPAKKFESTKQTSAVFVPTSSNKIPSQKVPPKTSSAINKTFHVSSSKNTKTNENPISITVKKTNEKKVTTLRNKKINEFSIKESTNSEVVSSNKKNEKKINQNVKRDTIQSSNIKNEKLTIKKPISKLTQRSRKEDEKQILTSKEINTNALIRVTKNIIIKEKKESNSDKDTVKTNIPIKEPPQTEIEDFSDEDDDNNDKFFIPLFSIQIESDQKALVKVHYQLPNNNNNITISKKSLIPKISNDKILYYKCEISGEVKEPKKDKNKYLIYTPECGNFKIIFRLPSDAFGNIKPKEFKVKEEKDKNYIEFISED